MFFAQEAKSWMVQNREKKLTRYDVSKLIGKAWGKAATVSNGVSALKCCGIYPFDPHAIADYHFSLSDSLQEQNLVDIDEVNNQSTRSTDESLTGNTAPATEILSQPGTSGLHSTPVSLHDDESVNTPQKHPQNDASQQVGICDKTPEEAIPSSDVKDKGTPSKVLSEIHPVPKLPKNLSKRKQTAIILTSPENIEKRTLLANKRKIKAEAESNKLKKAKTKVTNTKKRDDLSRVKGKKVLKKKPKKDAWDSSSSDSNDENMETFEESEEELSDKDPNRCAECTENYYQTQSTEDWIQCPTCSAWLHEFCTMYAPMCNRCGRKAKRASIQK
ncbi:unnamed protein product [Acanthoscelides obtectus]|uniref:Phorbol-ester/DAG-type domain-containing protein n=1 Tax=Acanthoscelides obtectus TaxID=200917 RepID=A0A9P0JSM1_ACAOB|nr:unnamed protein product [Acanthoscelides obtectus]CAK1663834.1 hypothetical protein AOBTE_LOCUS23880 [Acanthoscelides obtectus]